jgi:hypothetical protein
LISSPLHASYQTPPLTRSYVQQVWPKSRQSRAHPVGPGVEMRDDPVERRRRNRTTDPNLMDATSLE